MSISVVPETTTASNTYGTTTSLAASATTTLVSIPSSAAGYKVRGLVCSGNADGFFFIQVNSSTIVSGRIHSSNRTLEISLPNPVSVTAASVVELKVTNQGLGAADYESTLLGE